MPPDEATAQEVPRSSRLCVKNIPKYVDETRLKEVFGAKGEVTDVKVLRTKDGRSRQMGFIGFRSVDDASVALRYYNRSYMDTMRLEVEFARKVGDGQLPRAWSKHTTGTTANRKVAGAARPQSADGKGADDEPAVAVAGAQAKGKGKGKGKSEEEDPKLREFMALMQPRSKARVWGNDELPDGGDGAAAEAAAGPAGGGKRQKQQRDQRRAAAGSDGTEEEEEDDDAQYQDWTDAVARARRAGVGEDSEDEDAASGSAKEEEEDGQGEEGAGGPGRRAGGRGDEVVANEAISDLEYLRARMRRWDDDDDDEVEEEEEEEEEKAAAARGDQSGVGSSPRCTAAAAAGKPGRTATKAADVAAAAAATAAATGGAGTGVGGAAGRQGRGLRAGQAAAAEEEGDDALEGDVSDGGLEDPNVEMADGDPKGADAGGQRPGQQQKQGWQRPGQQHAAGGEGGGAGVEGAEEGMLETGRLFVRNLAYTATETDLSDLFGACGDLQEVHLVLDRETKRSKGLAYVQYQIPEDAVRAAQQLDGTIYQGRLLHILPAKKAPVSSGGGGPAPAGAEEGHAGEDGAGASSFKAQREVQRKADAGNRAAWNTLFMRADTVADAVAAHYGLSKAALLDAGTAGAGGDSVAVRMALGEAQVIAATKQALAEAGVSVEALEQAAAASGKASAAKSVARSGTTLIVKNLPYSADEDELAALFGRCGPLARLVLPPAKALALVEFTEPQDARAAFRSLAYKKYHHVPLYLEWAPADIFTAAPPPRQALARRQAGEAEGGKAGGKGARVAAPDAAAAMATAGADVADGEGATAVNPAVVGTIYVKNLAFATTDAALQKHFDRALSAVGGSLHSALVARKKAKDGAVQSLGYGFVEVDSEAVASSVIKKLQGSMLDGHKLALQLSKGRKDAAKRGGDGGAAAAAAAKMKGSDQDGSTKLVMRNLAFEATKKDIQGLFNPFGHLKSCRLPKKFDGSHRGFAFVEFVTKQEARNALEGVGGTHLYGRRLVVEYAKEEEGLDELRNKTAAKFKRDGELEAGDLPAKRLKV